MRPVKWKYHLLKNRQVRILHSFSAAMRSMTVLTWTNFKIPISHKKIILYKNKLFLTFKDFQLEMDAWIAIGSWERIKMLNQFRQNHFDSGPTSRHLHRVIWMVITVGLSDLLSNFFSLLELANFFLSLIFGIIKNSLPCPLSMSIMT